MLFQLFHAFSLVKPDSTILMPEDASRCYRLQSIACVHLLIALVAVHCLCLCSGGEQRRGRAVFAQRSSGGAACHGCAGPSRRQIVSSLSLRDPGEQHRVPSATVQLRSIRLSVSLRELERSYRRGWEHHTSAAVFIPERSSQDRSLCTVCQSLL